jgi:hypothetical protein
MRIPPGIGKYCTPNCGDRCVQCRCRHISQRRKRVCAIWKAYQEEMIKMADTIGREECQTTN